MQEKRKTMQQVQLFICPIRTQISSIWPSPDVPLLHKWHFAMLMLHICTFPSPALPPTARSKAAPKWDRSCGWLIETWPSQPEWGISHCIFSFSPLRNEILILTWFITEQLCLITIYIFAHRSEHMLSTLIETQLNLLLKAGRKTGKTALICLLKMASPHSWHIQQAHLLDANDSKVTASLYKSQPLFATALCGSKAGLDKVPLLENMGATGCLYEVLSWFWLG